MRIKHPHPRIIRRQAPKMEVSPERKLVSSGARRPNPESTTKITVLEVRGRGYNITLVTDKGEFRTHGASDIGRTVSALRSGQKARLFYQGNSITGICVYKESIGG